MVDETDYIVVTDDELEQDSKGELIKLAGRLRDRRNELNQLAAKRASKRDELNEKTRECVDQAQYHREKRDELNTLVQAHKEQRNKLNEKANELYERVEEKKTDLELDEGPDLDKLTEDIEALEFKQQTSVLSAEDERALIEQIEDKREEYRERKRKLEETGDIDEYVERAEQVRDEASKHHDKVTTLADKAQNHHNEMISAYRDADDIRSDADDMHEQFVVAQEAADHHHEEFVRVQKRLRELDKEEEQERRAERDEAREKARAEAEEIYQKFKEGETLDTEDLMKLQKTGLL